MVELDEATRRALLAREGPPPGAAAASLANLRARLGAPDGSDDPDDSGDLGAGGDLGSGGEAGGFGGAGASGPAGGQLAWAAKVVGATLGLTAAGLLTLKLGALALAGADTDAAPESTRERAALERSEARAFASADPLPSRHVVGEPPSSSPGREPAPLEERRPSASRSAAARSSDGQVAGDTSTLAAELALVRAAKRLGVDDPAAALTELARHEQRFPAGTLAPEREALRVEYLCRLGREAAAAELRARFLDQFGDSPLRARVLAACDEPGTDPVAAGD